MPPTLRSRRGANDANIPVADQSDTKTANVPRLKLSVNKPVPQKPSAATKNKPVALENLSVDKKLVLQKRNTARNKRKRGQLVQGSNSRVSTPFRILSLPDCVKENIAGHLDKCTLCKYRLVCKDFQNTSWAAFKALFNTTAVFLNYTSLRILLEISQHPILSSAIQTLHIVVCRWKTHGDQTYRHQPSPSSNKHSHNDNGGNPQYYAILDAEDDNTLREFNKMAWKLSRRLKLLDGLMAISIGDEFAGETLGATLIERSRGLRPNIRFPDYPKMSGQELEDYRASLCRATLMVMVALIGKAKPIESLTVRSIEMGSSSKGFPLQLLQLSPAQIHLIKPPFSALQRLDLQLDAHEHHTSPSIPISTIDRILGELVNRKYADGNYYDNFTRDWQFRYIGPALFDMVHNLTHLRLEYCAEDSEKEDERHGYIKHLKGLFDFVNLPKLCNFRLFGQSVPQAALQSFLFRHAHTLKSLELGKMGLLYNQVSNAMPKMLQSGWVGVFNYFVNDLGARHVRNRLELDRLVLWELNDGNAVQYFQDALEIEDDVRYELFKVIREMRGLEAEDFKPAVDSDSEEEVEKTTPVVEGPRVRKLKGPAVENVTKISSDNNAVGMGNGVTSAKITKSKKNTKAQIMPWTEPTRRSARFSKIKVAE